MKRRPSHDYQAQVRELRSAGRLKTGEGAPPREGRCWPGLDADQVGRPPRGEPALGRPLDFNR